MAVRYQLLERGVLDRGAGHNIQPGEPGWADYLAWLLRDNVPDPMDPPPPPPPPTEAEFIAMTVAAAQERLDAFARTRNYDGILSACTYATSTVPAFAVEGQYCVNARDQTWAALYALMADVQGGTLPMPESVAAVMALLPELVWPA